jgi:hypothetical protein
MTKGPQGDDIVILSRKKYDQLIAATNEDAADAEILRRSIACVKSGEEETFTSAEVNAFLASKTPLAFFRKKRGISQDALAKRAGITQKLPFRDRDRPQKAATSERCASSRTR